MDPNDDTVRSMADLLVVSKQNGDNVSLDGNVDGSVVDPDEVSINNRAFSRTNSMKKIKLNRLTSELMRHDAEGLEVEPSIVTDTSYQPKLLGTDGMSWVPGCLRREFLLKFFVALLFVCIVCSLVVIYHYYNNQLYEDELGRRIIFHEVSRLLRIRDSDLSDILHAHLGQNIPADLLPYNCGRHRDQQTELCLRWRDKAELDITYYLYNDTSCYDIGWLTFDEHFRSNPKDCFDLSWGSLYGGGLLSHQVWPLNDANITESSFITSSIFDESNFGPVIDRYWLLSQGVALFVEHDSPLHISLNEHNNSQLCLLSDPAQMKPVLNYTMCVGPLLEVHKVMQERFFEQPTTLPHNDMFTKPVWSTYGNFKSNINQDKIEGYARDISINYSHSLLIIEDGWQDSLSFNSDQFTQPSAFISDLHSLGFNVSLFVSPYFSIKSKEFHEIVDHGLAVTDAEGLVPGLTRWWNGPPEELSTAREISGLIDVNKGSKWYSEHLASLEKNFSVDAFHFWGAEASTLPYQSRAININNPSDYTTNYTRLAQSFSLTIANSAYQSQSHISFVRLSGTLSTWRAMQDVIPQVLTLSILGYPLVLPECIGGIGWPVPPDVYLFRRWMQLATFMPVMHFSKLPSVYGDEMNTFASQLIQFHADEISPNVLKLVSDRSFPIVRPLWWINTTDTESLTINSEFLIGDDLLVAPILEEQPSNIRDVYLPYGQWSSPSGQEYSGGQWLRNYSTSHFTGVPHFKRM